MEETTEECAVAKAPAGPTTALVVVETGAQFVTTVDEAKERVRQLQEFITSAMIRDVDYGVIPGTPKPTLYKPGAEKLCEIYGLAPHFDVVNRVEDWDEGFFHYETKCRLVSLRSGAVVAEGLGSCNSRERRFRNQDVYTAVNTFLKMSKKRSHVDATLSATRSSGLFTQDLEDLGDPRGSRFLSRVGPRRPNPGTAPAKRGISRQDLIDGWTRLVERGRARGIAVEPLDARWPDEEILRRGVEWKETIAAVEEALS